MGGGSIHQADARQFDALHMQLLGEGVQCAVEHFEAEYAADLSTGQGRVGQYDLAGAIAVELFDHMPQWLAVKDQYTTAPAGGRVEVETGQFLYTLLCAVAGALAFFQGLLRLLPAELGPGGTVL